MALSEPDAEAINEALKDWRQGDITLDEGLEFLHLGDLSRPHTEASEQTAAAFAETGEAVPVGPTPLMDGALHGLVVLSQTCDVVRDCRDRPYIEVAPLIEASAEQLEAARRLKMPAYAYIPAVAERRLVAHLDRVMTVEKSLVARWRRVPGWEHDSEVRAFGQALARKRVRFAFPDAFTEAIKRLAARLSKQHEKQNEDGAYLRALWQIRVRAAPAWEGEKVDLEWWFIKHYDPEGIEKVDWPAVVESWMSLFDAGECFTVSGVIVCRLEDMTARDYVESDILEFEHLSTARKK
ncbi:hypothetical protein [Methylobacterium iners]|nr:hypothetical protein [Methylobacterium iners]